MLDFTILAGSVLRLLFLLLAFLPVALLARRYDRAIGLKKSFASMAAYFFLATVHYLTWEYVVFFKGLPTELASGNSPVLFFSAAILVLGVSVLHFGISRLHARLFSEDVAEYRFLAGFFAGTTGLVVVASAFPAGFFSAVLKGIYVSSWVSLAASYALLTNLYRRFGTKYAGLSYAGALAASLNIAIFLLASAKTEAVFFELRLFSYLVLLVGGTLAAVPGFFLFKDLVDVPEKLSEKARPPLYHFIHRYSEEYAKVIGAVSYSLLDQGIASFREASGIQDFKLEKGRSLSRENSARLLQEIFSSYRRITGRLAQKLAEDVLSGEPILSKESELSSAIQDALSFDAPVKP